MKESDNQEGFEKTLFTPALTHNFVSIVFKIQTKEFSDILNDQSFLEHFTPDWAKNFLLLWILSTH